MKLVLLLRLAFLQNLFLMIEIVDAQGWEKHTTALTTGRQTASTAMPNVKASTMRTNPASTPHPLHKMTTSMRTIMQSTRPTLNPTSTARNNEMQSTSTKALTSMKTAMGISKTTTPTTTSTTTTTPPAPSDKAIRVQFRVNRDYEATVGDAKNEWENHNRKVIARATEVVEQRITSLDISDGSIFVDFVIEPSSVLNVRQPTDIPSETAKDNIEQKINDNSFRLEAPPPSNQRYAVDKSSFKWQFVEEGQEVKADEEDEGGLDLIYIILICIGAFLVILLFVAIIVILVMTRNEKRDIDDGHYANPSDEESIIASSIHSDKSTPKPDITPMDGTFEY